MAYDTKSSEIRTEVILRLPKTEIRRVILNETVNIKKDINQMERDIRNIRKALNKMGVMVL